MKRAARARVLQALYAWDLRGEQRLERVAAQIWDDLAVPADERAFAAPLVRTLVEHGAALDAELADVTTNWRLERLGVDRALRAPARRRRAAARRDAAARRHPGSGAPRRALRHEKSAKFVNGVLDALARRMGRI